MAIDIHKNKGNGLSKVDGRYLGVAIAIAVAFFVSYGYASAARNAASSAAYAGNSASGQYATTGGAGAAGGAGGGCGMSGGGGGGGCCGGGGPQKTVAGSTTVAGGVQKVEIDLTTGSYSPNEITAKAGVPIELDFKGPASSCNGYVQSQQLGFSQDVSNGGTIKVGPLQPGTYTFACSMNMYTATIVVK